MPEQRGDGEKFTTACTGTLVYRTKGWDCEKVKIVNASLVKRLINATNANKVWYYLMQIAWTLWQMFQRGFLLRLETGCRKMTQVLWCEELRTYIRHFGCAMLVARYRLMCRKNL